MDVIAILAAIAGFIVSWVVIAKKLANKMWLVRHLAGLATGFFVFCFIGVMSVAAGFIQSTQPETTAQVVTETTPAKNEEPKPALPQKTDQNILINASDIIRVSDYEFTLSDKQAVSIAFGEPDSNWCDVTIHRENVYEGYSVHSVRRNNYKEVSFECYTDGMLLILNDNIDTNVKLELTTLDHQNKTARVVISAKLHELTKASENRFGSIARLMAVELKITGQHFENLIKQM